MTDREIMQQALEALDAYSWEQVQSATTALRDRLEQPEQEPVAWIGLNLDNMAEAFHRVIEEHHSRKNPFHDPVNGDAMIALRELRGLIAYMKRNTAPPQRKPEQEPVAWLYRDSWGTMKLSQVTPPPVGAFPVYTTPQQRKPLSDEWIHRTTVLLGFNPEWTTEIGIAHAIVRAAEAAHDIKGEA